MRSFFLVTYQRPWFTIELPSLFWTLLYWFPVHIEVCACVCVCVGECARVREVQEHGTS